MANRNVDLLIRARDNASRAFKSVSTALDELSGIQTEVSSGADKLDSALTRSRTAAKGVADAIGKDAARGAGKAAEIFERIEQTVAAATRQFQKQKDDLAENREAYKALGKQAESAAEMIRKAEAKIGPQTEEQTRRLEAARKEYRSLGRVVTANAGKLQKQELALEGNAGELQKITNAAIAASSALREVGVANARAQGVSKNKATTEAANQSARKGLAQLAKAERAIQIEIEARAAAAQAAAAEEAAANRKLVGSVRDVVQAEERLAAIQARRAAMAQARTANAAAKSGLAGITAGLIAKTRAENASAAAAAASTRAQNALAASYQKQLAAARPTLAEQKKLTQSFRESFTAALNTKSPIRQLVQEVTRLGPAADSGAQGMRRLSARMTDGRQAFRAFYGDSRRALSLMQRVRGEVLSLTASFIGFYGVFNVGRGILESFQRLEAAQNRLGAAFEQDYDKVNSELTRLNSEASRLGISFDVLSSNYSNFLISGQQAGLEVGQLRTIFRQVSEAGRVLKLSNEQIEGTFNALIQIAGKGTLQMEELRQQLGDRLPGAVGLLAKALGYGEGELARFYKDVTNGAVGAEEALVALGQGLEDQYGGQLEDALSSVTAKVGNLQNLLFQRQLTASNSGFISGLETALDALNAWLDSPEGVDFFESLGAAFGRLFKVLPVVLDNFDTLAKLFKTFVAIKIGQVVAGLGGNLAKLSRISVGNLRVQVALNRAVASFSPAASRALASATALGAGLRGVRAIVSGLLVTFRAVFASFGGIIGIAAAALSFFAFSAVADTTEALDTLNVAMEDSEDTIGLVGKAFMDAAGDAEEFKRNLAEINKLDIKLDLKNLRQEIADAVNGKGSRNAISGVIKEVWELEKAINASVSDPRARAYFLRLTGLFDRGKISARELREGVNELAGQFKEIADVTGLDGFVEWLDTLAAAEEKIARLEAELAVIEGTASDAQRELLGLAASTDEASRKADAAQKQYDAFAAAMRELGELVPGINDKLEEFDAIREIEANFQAAMKAANDFTDAAQRAAAIGSAVDLRNQAYRGLYDGQIADYDGTDGGEVAADFLRNSEGFRSTPYNDPRTDANGNQVGPDIFRGGYGSDTVTLDDGSIVKITEGMRVSVADAERDLRRRIETEFLPTARRQAGAERFDSFNAQQQAALASIAYNYGELPDRIIEAVRTGTDEEVATAIRGLARDNGGQNRGRRNREAALFTSRHGDAAQVEAFADAEKTRQDALDKLEKKRKEFREGLEAEIAQTEFLNSLEGKRMIDAEVLKALKDAENDAAKLGLTLTKEQREEIERVTRAKFAAKQVDEDRAKQLESAKKLEEDVTLLQERRRYLAEQITMLEGNGDMVGAARISEELVNVEAQLDTAIEKALAFWEAMGGEVSERAILALKSTQQELKTTESTAITSGKQINDMFAGRIVSAIDSFNQRVAAGEDAVSAFKDEFLKMAADILIEIGRMIIQQAIFNALSGAFGGGTGGQGGIGGLIAGGINSLFAHNGGIAGKTTSQSGRTFNPAIFANAAKYHGGGIAGLAPDELPAILKRNEEVLTEGDPRHRFNGGLAGGSQGSGKTGMTIINAFDAEEMMERALSTPRGEEILVNAVRSSRTEVKAALG